MNQLKKSSISQVKSKISTQPKKSFAKKISITIGGLIGFGMLPLITLAAKNNDPYNTILFKEITAVDVQNNVEYKDLSNVNISYGELIRGTTQFNNGNYVLYLGTEACSHCAEFLFNNPDFANGTPPLGNAANNASWSRGIWGKGIDYAAKSINDIEVKFVMFEDHPPVSNEATSDRYFTLPWSKNPDSNFESGIVAGEYVRNDQSALNFREIFNFAQANYSQVVGTPTVIAFKNGLFNWYNLTNKVEETPSEDSKENETKPETVNTAGTVAQFIEFLRNLYNTNN